MNTPSTTEFAAFVGIDWADRKHDVCLLAAGSSTREFSVLVHRPEEIAQWAEGLRQRFGGRPIAVCLEIVRGPLVYALQRYAFLVLFPVNPATLGKRDLKAVLTFRATSELVTRTGRCDVVLDHLKVRYAIAGHRGRLLHEGGPL
jgi:hypothetical protein